MLVVAVALLTCLQVTPSLTFPARVRQHTAVPWPDRKIPYHISSQFSNEVSTIREAMLELTKDTCVQFVQKEPSHADYVSITPSEDCKTTVGRIGGMQELELSPDCASDTTVLLHELMHVLGFFHEHSREDRNQYVTVHFENIAKDDHPQFEIFRSLMDVRKLPYDYHSILHYTSHYKSKNGQPTITAIDGRSTFGSSGVLTAIDRAKINALYRCDQSQTMFKPHHCFDKIDDCKASLCQSPNYREICSQTCMSCLPPS